jgi:hypothetical protein
MKKTFAHCQYFTNLPGQSCPLCGVAITPNVGHACATVEERKDKKKCGKSLVGLTIPERTK